jgi:serine/threonine protein kinase
MGLRFLHDLEIVHRNVSPDTVIFDRQGHIILSGIENSVALRRRNHFLADSALDKDNRNQAPEILLGWCHDKMVDSWAFGVVFYFMHHGKVSPVSSLYSNSFLTRIRIPSLQKALKPRIQGQTWSKT